MAEVDDAGESANGTDRSLARHGATRDLVAPAAEALRVELAQLEGGDVAGAVLVLEELLAVLEGPCAAE